MADDNFVNFATVLTTRDPGLLAITKSLLDASGIPYVVGSEHSQPALPIPLWLEVKVPAAMASNARRLLADLER